jgi:ribonuclease P protein component
LINFSIIKKNQDFNVLFSDGALFSSKYFTAFVLESEKQQVGFATQKGFQNKIQRNRLKRISKELWRRNTLRTFSVKVVIVARIEGLTKRFKELEIDFDDLLFKIEQAYKPVKPSSISCL